VDSQEPVYSLLLFFERYFQKNAFPGLSDPLLGLQELRKFEMTKLWHTLDQIVLKIDKIENKGEQRNVTTV